MALFEVRGSQFVGYIRVIANPNAVLTAVGAGVYTAVADSNGNAIIKVLRSGTYEISSNLSNRKCTATVSQYAQVVDAVYKWNRYYIKPLYTYVDFTMPTYAGTNQHNIYNDTGGRVSTFVARQQAGAQAHQALWTHRKPDIGFDATDGTLTVTSTGSYAEGEYNASGDINTRSNFSFFKGLNSNGKATAIAQAWFIRHKTDWDYTDGSKAEGSWVLTLTNYYYTSDSNQDQHISSYFYSYQYSSACGDYIGVQYAHAINAYPDNYMQSGYWYISQ